MHATATAPSFTSTSTSTSPVPKLLPTLLRILYCISSRQQHRRLVLVLVDAANPPASLRPRAASSRQYEIPAIEVERRGSHGLSSSTWILDSTNSTTHILRVLAKSPPAILPTSLQHNLSSAQGLIRTLPALSGHLSDTAITYSLLCTSSSPRPANPSRRVPRFDPRRFCRNFVQKLCTTK